MLILRIKFKCYEIIFNVGVWVWKILVRSTILLELGISIDKQEKIHEAFYNFLHSMIEKMRNIDNKILLLDHLSSLRNQRGEN